MKKPPAEWVRNASDELAVRNGCYFDAASGEFVCEYLETFCYLSEGEWAGRPMELFPWERDLVMRLYGWKRDDGRRRFRRLYCEVAKKNGKSPLVSGLSNYSLIADDEGGPKVYLNACDREQARIVFEHASAMVRQSPELVKRCEVIDSRNRIVCRETNGVIIANSALVDAKDGRNASVVIFDELHRQPDRKLWNVFKYAGASRRQPLTISITTAGEDETGVWHDQRDYSEKVNEGKIHDITHLGVIYRALPTDDVDDPETWKKANPSLGLTITLESFANDLAEAKAIPVDWNEFLRLRLNIIARAADKFFPGNSWDDCNGASNADSLRGMPCWVGADLASVNDLTAVVAVFGSSEDGFDVLAWFYLPEDNILTLERQHKVPYRHWADAGFITLTPGGSVDYKFVRKQIKDLADAHPVRMIAFDPYNAEQVVNEMEADGLPVLKLRQGPLSLNAPTKELLRLVLSGKLRHGGHPVLAWNAGNAVATKDENDNIRINKKKSREKIDGISALVNAIAAATQMAPDETSPYESRGVLYI